MKGEIGVFETLLVAVGKNADIGVFHCLKYPFFRGDVLNQAYCLLPECGFVDQIRMADCHFAPEYLKKPFDIIVQQREFHSLQKFISLQSGLMQGFFKHLVTHLNQTDIL